MKLVDVCSGITWSSGKLQFLPYVESSSLYAEYLNGIYPKSLDSEIELLERFSEVIKSENNEKFEKIIVNEFEGFHFLNGEPFIKICGAHDLSPQILYSPKTKIISIFHPNTKEKLTILSLEDLLNILYQLRLLSICV